MKTGNCYKQDVKKFDLVVAEDSEFDLSRDVVYVVLDVIPFHLIKVKNDKDVEDTYTTECFRFYEGERVERKF